MTEKYVEFLLGFADALRLRFDNDYNTAVALTVARDEWETSPAARSMSSSELLAEQEGGWEAGAYQGREYLYSPEFERDGR
jgi:hypothetical protein